MDNLFLNFTVYELAVRLPIADVRNVKRARASFEKQFS